MPDTTFLGIDIDDIFKLATPKYVYIRDWKLGALKYLLMVGILFYVLGYDILYSCSHLIPNVATGYGSIDLKHPVEDCTHGTCIPAYKNIANLPYCSESKHFISKKTTSARRRLDMEENEEDADAEEDGSEPKAVVGDFISPQAECRYLDNDRLTMEEVPNELFVPLRYVSHQQEMSDDCYDPAVSPLGHHARKHSEHHYRCKSSWRTKNRSDFYVADIEHFSLTMKHSFMSPSISMAGVSTGLAGFMQSCTVSHPKSDKDCFKMKIPGTNYSRQHVAEEDLEGAHHPKYYNISSLAGTPGGLDVISIGDLFRLTPDANENNWQSDSRPQDAGLIGSSETFVARGGRYVDALGEL